DDTLVSFLRRDGQSVGCDSSPVIDEEGYCGEPSSSCRLHDGRGGDAVPRVEKIGAVLHEVLQAHQFIGFLIAQTWRGSAWRGRSAAQGGEPLPAKFGQRFFARKIRKEA